MGSKAQNEYFCSEVCSSTKSKKGHPRHSASCNLQHSNFLSTVENGALKANRLLKMQTGIGAPIIPPRTHRNDAIGMIFRNVNKVEVIKLDIVFTYHEKKPFGY